jgi:hypothetical protein
MDCKTGIDPHGEFLDIAGEVVRELLSFGPDVLTEAEAFAVKGVEALREELVSVLEFRQLAEGSDFIGAARMLHFQSQRGGALHQCCKPPL